MRFVYTAALAAELAALGLTAAAAEPVSGYTTGSVNQRTGPGVSYPVITTLPSGAEISIYGCLPAPSWCDIDAYGRRGWVSAAYVQGGYAYYPPNYGGYVYSGDEGGWYNDRREYRHRRPGYPGPATNYMPPPGSPPGYCERHRNSPDCGAYIGNGM